MPATPSARFLADVASVFLLHDGPDLFTLIGQICKAQTATSLQRSGWLMDHGKGMSLGSGRSGSRG